MRSARSETHACASIQWAALLTALKSMKPCSTLVAMSLT